MIFKTADEKISIDVRFEGEIFWFIQAQMVDFYESNKENVSETKACFWRRTYWSIFTNLKKDILKNFLILLPSTETLSKFQNIIKVIFEKVLATQREIKQLETLRDTLLPKLMNGEIEVNTQNYNK